MRKDPDILNSISSLLSKEPGFVILNNKKIENILENLSNTGARCVSCASKGTNAGIKFVHEIITDLEYAITNFKKTPGFDKLITEMAASAEKADGGSFLIQVLKAKGDEFVGNIREFESFYLSGARFEADIALNSGKLMEFKSFAKNTWQNFGDESSLNQLKAYLRSGNKFEYIANKTKLLNDGVADPLKFTKEQFQRVFKKDTYKIYNEIISENPNSLKTFGIYSKDDFIQDISDLNNAIYKFIKIE